MCATIGAPLLIQLAVTFYIRISPPLDGAPALLRAWLRLPYPRPPSWAAMGAAWLSLLLLWHVGLLLQISTFEDDEAVKVNGTCPRRLLEPRPLLVLGDAGDTAAVGIGQAGGWVRLACA